MRLTRVFGKSRNDNNVSSISVETEKHDTGIKFFLYKGSKENTINLPLRLSVTELRRQKNLDQVEVLEELWYQEWLEDKAGFYLLPYHYLYELPD
ncbi:hypothetical protein DCC39_18015 [Pueribacillus theae]|uniref:Uncharacterized protein n=1 Tax=Pueribacillus theae TaxID=2171751 RepID=A0A2U1JKJ6_9BACI|nr:hypothetical protein [Pueribacillus theae]PWA05514.1 hypothetical protein DCC39_18015 [Pueribacillus theae]